MLGATRRAGKSSSHGRHEPVAGTQGSQYARTALRGASQSRLRCGNMTTSLSRLLADYVPRRFYETSSASPWARPYPASTENSTAPA
jgi:hypothetical protein